MIRNYSSKAFFRQVPNALLARYFQGRGLFGDLDFAAMKEGKPEELFKAWLALPDSQRSEIDTEFQEIFEMSCEKGFKAIIDEAGWQMRKSQEELQDFVDKLSALSNHYERAMVVFLEHNPFWRGATRFYHADSLTSSWRKRKNLPQLKAAVDKGSLEQLAGLIGNYFHHTEGRGKNCVVEPFRRGELDYFFAYPEDYSQQSVEWVNGEFDRRPHNPAFEVIYIYSQKEGSLDLHFRGSKKATEALQGMFAEAILKIEEVPPDPRDERIYDLSPLLQRSFDFTYAVGSGIEEVMVKKLRFSSLFRKGERITLEADITQSAEAIYDLLEQIGKSVPLHMYRLTQVEITAWTVQDSDKDSKRTNFRVTYPNSCSLKYDMPGLKLRDMLEASGIEPKAGVKKPRKQK